MMTHVRSAAVSGTFYPGRRDDLERTVRALIRDAAATAPAGPVPKAIIAPHAGYIYSGAVAATAYARIAPARGLIRRVVLLGPCHRVPVQGLALSTAEAFETPLGPVTVDGDAVQLCRALPQVVPFDPAHANEHSLEVHLPFLQTVLDDFTLVPLAVGRASAEEVADVLEALWGGPETLIVISTDLSHFLDYETAKRVDAETCHAIETLDWASIDYERACGRMPLSGLLAVAHRRRLQVRTLDLRNSGDTAGDRRRVVGYGAWVVGPPAAAATTTDEPEKVKEIPRRDATGALLDVHGETLLRVAATSIEHGLATGRPAPVQVGDFPLPLQALGATFVTLRSGENLRGCIGSPEAQEPLVADVAENAFASAFRDSRFPPLSPPERDGLAVSISLLGPADEIGFVDEAGLLAQLRPGRDGIVLASDHARALFLPQVWESLADPHDFLAQLKLKAGLTADYWGPDMRAWRFTTTCVSSDDLPDPGALWR